jgi:hypothetical protein
MAGEPYSVNPGDRLTAGWMNAVVGAVKRRKIPNSRGVQWAGSGDSCVAFSILKAVADKIFITGGICYAGDKNLVVEDYEISLASTGEWLVSLQLDVEANRDTNNEIILPGIKTTTDTPEYNLKVWTDGTSYDSNTNPDVATGIGTVVVPLGKLIITGTTTKTPNFEPVSCGDIRITQCGGILSHKRV